MEAKLAGMYMLRKALSRAEVSKAWSRAGSAVELAEGCLDASDIYPAGGMRRAGDDAYYSAYVAENYAWRSDL